ncbi:MAG: hypothetical protein PHW52_04125 [Candidatus Pacebacteria bacterium]|nr:hypothetical protein [Candidatus Paceibacterota bacterium]
MMKSGYFSGYGEPKSIEEQVRILKGSFPYLDYSIKGDFCRPKGSEGLFVIPKWNKVGETYLKATLKVIDILRSLYGGRIIKWGNDFTEYTYYQNPRSQKAIEFINEQHPSDIVILPAQFGMRLKGSSVANAKKRFYVNEFGLSTYEVGIMLITHQERLQQYDDLRIYCLGDDVRNGIYRISTWMYVHEGFNISGIRDDLSNRHSGGVTGFLPDRVNIDKVL